MDFECALKCKLKEVGRQDKRDLLRWAIQDRWRTSEISREIFGVLNRLQANADGDPTVRIFPNS
jgi:hypothetical protein